MLSFKALADLNCVWEENNNPKTNPLYHAPKRKPMYAAVSWFDSLSHKQDLHDFSPQSQITTSFAKTPKPGSLPPPPSPPKQSKINHKNSRKANLHLKALFSSGTCRQIHSSSDNFISMIYSSDYTEHLELNKKQQIQLKIKVKCFNKHVYMYCISK